MMKTGILALFFLFLLNLHAEMAVVRVLPDKINYRLKENAVISVTLANRGPSEDGAELFLFDKWDLEQEKLIVRQSVHLAGKTERTFRIPWNSGEVRYGHEVRAVLKKDGREIAAKSEFFNVINEWWRVNIGITPSVVAGTEQGDRLCAWYGFRPYHTPFSRFYHNSWGESPIGPFATYFTNTTPWNMAFSTFGVYYDPSLKENETWYAGTEARTYEDFRKDTALSRKWGVHRTMFTISCATNEPGFELARKHPQFFLKDAKGDFQYHDPVDPLGLSRKGKPYGAGWSYLKPDFTNREVWKFSMDTLIEGLKHLGQDGVYFDGAYRCDDGYDYEGNLLRGKYDFDETNRALSAYINQRLRAFRPDLYLWVNNGAGGSYRNILSNPASGALWELGNFHQDPHHPLNLWSSIKESAVNARNQLWETGYREDVKSNILHIGYSNYPTGLWFVGPSAAKWAQKGLKYTNFKPSRQFWCINSHLAAIMAAVCGHPYGDGMAYRPFTQMMTRYSDFYWNEDVRLVRKAFRKFNLDSLRDVWWEDFVYTRSAPDHKDYYIHLLNAPDTLRHSFSTIRETKEAKGVEISSRIFKDAGRLRAWAIQPYGLDSAVLEPAVRSITPKKVDGELVFTLPSFRYYTLLVIRETIK